MADADRLSAPGIRASGRIAEAWGLSEDERIQLLGFDPLTIGDAILSDEQLQRVSHVLGIYKSLHTLLKATADGWVKRPNADRLFGGCPPIEVMVSGLEGLRSVRMLLGAECA